MRLLVVEDHRPTLDAIVTVIQERRSSWSLSSACSIAEALQLIAGAQARFDVALVDMHLEAALSSAAGSGGTRCIAVLEALVAQGTPALVLTNSNERSDFIDAIHAGARGYLLKHARPDRILEAVEAVARGESPLASEMATYLLPQREDATVRLTPREQDVLLAISRGLTYSECAEALRLKLGTVQGYVKTIYAKLDVTNKAEASAWAQRRGLLG